jgi:hypothetical protein
MGTFAVRRCGRLVIAVRQFLETENRWFESRQAPITSGGYDTNMYKGLFTRTVVLTVSDATAASKDRNNPIFVRCRMRLSHPTLSKSLSV